MKTFFQYFAALFITIVSVHSSSFFQFPKGTDELAAQLGFEIKQQDGALCITNTHHPDRTYRSLQKDDLPLLHEMAFSRPEIIARTLYAYGETLPLSVVSKGAWRVDLWKTCPSSLMGFKGESPLPNKRLTVALAAGKKSPQDIEGEEPGVAEMESIALTAKESSQLTPEDLEEEVDSLLFNLRWAYLLANVGSTTPSNTSSANNCMTEDGFIINGKRMHTVMSTASELRVLDFLLQAAGLVTEKVGESRFGKDVRKKYFYLDLTSMTPKQFNTYLEGVSERLTTYAPTLLERLNKKLPQDIETVLKRTEQNLSGLQEKPATILED